MRYWWIGFGMSLSLTACLAASRLKDAEEYRKFYGLTAYPTAQLQNMKVAVLDIGFAGLEKDKSYLPESAEIVENYDPEFIKRNNLGDPKYQSRFAPTEHGRIMAQILWATTGFDPKGPKFYLLNATGITNFRRAVRYAIEQKVDVILYSQNLECCGNFDGGGFYNAIVNQATNAGILWINAAGNYGGRIFNSEVKVGSDNTLTFAGERTFLRLKSHLDENTVQIILNWNSSGDAEDTGTDKDLDLYLLDSNGKEVAKGALKQVWKKAALEDGETFLPRERIKLNLEAKTEPYRIVVKSKSTNFTARDHIRITVIGEREQVMDAATGRMVDSAQFLDALPGREIMVPGDNPNVLTVGDMGAYSASGPTVDSRIKPEIILEKTDAVFTDGKGTTGTSNAAAFFAGIVTVLKSQRTSLTRNEILNYVKTLSSAPAPVVPQLPSSGVTLNEVARYHRDLLVAMEERLDEAPVIVGQKKNGQFLLGYRPSVQEVVGSVCGRMPSSFASSNTWYVVKGSSNRLPANCSQAKGVICCSDANVSPWDFFGVHFTRFLEIRQAKRSDVAGGLPEIAPLPNSGLRIWKTPTLQNLLGW